MAWWGGTVSPPPVHGQHSSPNLLSCLAHPVLLGLAEPGNGTGLGFSHLYCWFESMGNQNCGQSCWVRSLSGAGDLSPALWRLAMCRDGSIVQGCFLAPSYLVRQIRGNGELCRTGFFWTTSPRETSVQDPSRKVLGSVAAWQGGGSDLFCEFSPCCPRKKRK